MVCTRREWLFLDPLFGGVTRAYDVFKKMRKYSRGGIPQLPIWNQLLGQKFYATKIISIRVKIPV